ncbi:hypothetical protein ACS0TY_012026 [Phlomoides rotata]
MLSFLKLLQFLFACFIDTCGVNYLVTRVFVFSLLHIVGALASSFRARCRLPVISWCNPGEKLVAALWTQLSGVKERRRYCFNWHTTVPSNLAFHSWMSLYSILVVARFLIKFSLWFRIRPPTL